MDSIAVNTVKHRPTKFELSAPFTANDILAAPQVASSRDYKAVFQECGGASNIVGYSHPFGMAT
jgi:hypothetical protein